MGLAGYKIKEQITTQHLRVGPRLLEPLAKATMSPVLSCHDAPLRLQLLRTEEATGSKELTHESGRSREDLRAGRLPFACPSMTHIYLLYECGRGGRGVRLAACSVGEDLSSK